MNQRDDVTILKVISGMLIVLVTTYTRVYIQLYIMLLLPQLAYIYIETGCICLYMGGCIDGYVDTYRHMGIMHVHMCIHMVGLHIRTGWPAHASAGSRAYTHT